MENEAFDFTTECKVCKKKFYADEPTFDYICFRCWYHIPDEDEDGDFGGE